MSPDLRQFAQADKVIPSFHDWRLLDRNYLSWTSPLDVDGVTIQGLRLRLSAFEMSPDEAVRVQLEWQSPGGKSEPLIRVEWRPLHPHNNKGRGPAELQFKPFRRTHVHPFEMNWSDNHQRLLTGNLPIAVPLQDVDSYENFLDLAGIETKVLNLKQVPPPPWQRRMV